MSRVRPEPERPGTGVVSVPDDDAIDRWLRVPPADRLRWLAEANAFLYRAQPSHARAAWNAWNASWRDEL